MKNPHVPDDKKNISKLSSQYLACGIVTLGAFASGATLSWSSAAIPLLQEEEGRLHEKITEQQGSWIASILCLGAFFGAVPAGIISEYFGKKKTLLCLALPMLVSWILIASSPSLWGLYVGRFVAGIATGAVSVTIPVYVADIVEPRLREKFANLYHLQLAGGILFGFITGLIRNDTIVFVLSASLPIAYLIACVFMPESPVYLMSQGKTNEARIALQFFRGVNNDIEEELTNLKANIRESLNDKANFKDLVNNTSTLKALFVSFGLMSFQQLSGINAIIFYATKIFTNYKISNSPQGAAIALGFFHVFSTYFSSVFLSRFKSRRLLLVSFISMSFSLAVTGIFFHLKASGIEMYNWLPVFSLCFYICAYSCGVGPIPWMMLRQIFPANVTRRATAFAAGFNWLLAFGVTKLFQNICDIIKVGWLICNISGICLIGALFVYLAVPETKNKSFEEIQNSLNGIKAKKRHRHIIEIESESEV